MSKNVVVDSDFLRVDGTRQYFYEEIAHLSRKRLLFHKFLSNEIVQVTRVDL